MREGACSLTGIRDKRELSLEELTVYHTVYKSLSNMLLPELTLDT